MGKKEQLTIDLKNTEVRCEKQHTAYQVVDADNGKAIDSLKNAISSMNAAKPAAAAAGLVSVRAKIEKSAAFNEAMKELDAGDRWKSFLQVDPSDPGYKHHSQGIIDMMADILKEFEAKKAEDDAE